MLVEKFFLNFLWKILENFKFIIFSPFGKYQTDFQKPLYIKAFLGFV